MSVFKEMYVIKGKCGCQTESLGVVGLVNLSFTIWCLESLHVMGQVLLLYKGCELWSIRYVGAHILEMPLYFEPSLYVVNRPVLPNESGCHYVGLNVVRQF